jgi:hypothetical protein
MKLPRYSLRTLFVLIALVGVWSAFQLNWIRQRHKFIMTYGTGAYANYTEIAFYNIPGEQKALAPLSLRLFGEWGWRAVGCPEAQAKRARELFPEALHIFPYPDR